MLFLCVIGADWFNFKLARGPPLIGYVCDYVLCRSNQVQFSLEILLILFSWFTELCKLNDYILWL